MQWLRIEKRNLIVSYILKIFVISTPISFASVLARVPWESHHDVWHSCTLKSKTDLAVLHKGAGGPILTESSSDSSLLQSRQI
jgi:hypothetical protein